MLPASSTFHAVWGIQYLLGLPDKEMIFIMSGISVSTSVSELTMSDS